MADSTPLPNINILISGGGIAGNSLACYLSKCTSFTSQITILERFPNPRTSGQAIDIRDAGVTVINRMGMTDKIRAMHTTETGIQFLWADTKRATTFMATGDTKEQSLTSEFEILRGDLAHLLLEETKALDNVRLVFGETIQAISQDENATSAHVTFANGKLAPASFDLVVGADGMISNTRRCIWGTGPNDNNFLRSLGQHVSFFTIPKTDDDTKLARWYNAPKGRSIFLRPSPYEGETRGFLGVTDAPNSSRFDVLRDARKDAKGDDAALKAAQMKWLEEEFRGVGWEAPRVVAGMLASDDFYMQEIAQVKVAELVKGRVALVGDAGFCPSPISGMGTTAALVGAFVLAGEIASSPTDISRALQNYNTTVRPWVDRCQSLPPGAPALASPQSEWGIWVLNRAMEVASKKTVQKAAKAVGKWFVPRAFGDEPWVLPVYEAMKL